MRRDEFIAIVEGGGGDVRTGKCECDMHQGNLEIVPRV